MQLRFNRPLETTRVVLSRIATHDQHHVGVLDVDPAVGHCAASEGGPQTGDRRTVSNPGLRFEVAEAQAAHCLYGEKIQFVRVSAAADPTDCFHAIDGVTALVFLNERGVACLLGPASNLIDGLVPGDVFPVIRTWTSHSRFHEPTVVDDFLLERSAFGTQRAAIDWSVGVAFDMDHLWNRILRFVAESVNDDAAAYGAIRTD